MPNKKYKKINDQKGFSLLIALLVMGVVLVISLSISTLMVSEIKLVGAYDDSVIAYYAADAGIEYALREVKNEQEFTELADNNPQWTVKHITDSVSGSLKQDESIEVDLKEGRPPIITIKWGSCNDAECATEWTLIGYQKSGSDYTLPNGKNIDKGLYQPSGASNPALDYSDSKNSAYPLEPGENYVYTRSSISTISGNPNYSKMITIELDDTYLYKLRFKCLATATNTNPSLRYEIAAAPGESGPISPAGFAIGSTGTSNSVNRRIEVKNNGGVMGIFDYVLYSEEALNKP